MSCLSFFSFYNYNEQLIEKYYSTNSFYTLQNQACSDIWSYVTSKVDDVLLDTINLKLKSSCNQGIMLKASHGLRESGTNLLNTVHSLVSNSPTVHSTTQEKIYFFAGRPHSLKRNTVIDDDGVIPQMKLTQNVHQLQQVLANKKQEYIQNFSSDPKSEGLACLNAASQRLEQYTLTFLKNAVKNIINHEYLYNRWNYNQENPTLKIWSRLALRNPFVCNERRKFAEATLETIAATTSITALKLYLEARIKENVATYGTSHSFASLDITLKKALKSIDTLTQREASEADSKLRYSISCEI